VGRTKVENPEHGSELMYRRCRCRCDVCRGAHTVRQRAYYDYRGGRRKAEHDAIRIGPDFDYRICNICREDVMTHSLMKMCEMEERYVGIR